MPRRSANAPLTEAQQELVLSAVEFVRHAAHRYADGDYDDVVAAGYRGLCIAAGQFDPSRNLKFLTYARWWVRREMCRHVERERKHRVVRLPSDVIFRDESGEWVAESHLDIRNAAKEALGAMSPVERRAVALRFGFGCAPMSYPEIARRMEIGLGTAHALVSSGLAKARSAPAGQN